MVIVDLRNRRGHWKNTFISATRAMEDYLLDIELVTLIVFVYSCTQGCYFSDLEDLTVRTVRSAHEDALPMTCYLKSDVEKR